MRPDFINHGMASNYLQPKIVRCNKFDNCADGSITNNVWGGAHPKKSQKIPKNPKKTQSQFTDFGVATGIFWDFLGFLGFFGIFWVFWDFLGFFGIFWVFLGFFGFFLA